MPPASFLSLTARSTPSFSLCPVAALSPLSGPNTPILSVCAGAVPLAVDSRSANAAACIKDFVRCMASLSSGLMNGSRDRRAERRCRMLSRRVELPIFPAEIARPDLRVVEQACAGPGEHDPSGFEHIAALRQLQRQLGVL